MRFVVEYDEDGQGQHAYRFGIQSQDAAEEWARAAVREGLANATRVAILEDDRPIVKYINIDGEAVRVQC